VAPRLHVWGFHAAYLGDPDGNIWEIYATTRRDV
jgi:catechol-2,3-dioxygenase